MEYNSQYSEDRIKYHQIAQKYLQGFQIQPHPGFATKCIHEGQDPKNMPHGAVNTPIITSTTFAQRSPGEPLGSFDYARCGNPTRESFEQALAAVEYAQYCISFASGCGAMTCLMLSLKTGDHVICCDDVYGGTQRYMRRIGMAKQGISFDFIDLTDIELVKRTINENTKMLWIETPTNPTLKICDIKLLAEIAHSRGIIVVADNTFATPYLQSPILLGADISLNSCTKYIGGHSDVVQGALCLNDKELYDHLFLIAKSTGANPGPFDSYLALRGLKTLKIRVEAASKNAVVIANFLRDHPKVKKVVFPGFKEHPGHEICRKQMRGYGAMISMYIDGGLEEAKKFLQNVSVFTLAESLGGVESLIESPALMTHASVPAEKRKELNIEDDFIRISVGIEDVEDQLADLDYALSKV